MKPDDKLEETYAAVYAGDCITIMQDLRNDGLKVDLLFADPPFNYGEKYDSWDDKMPEKDFLEFTKTWLQGASALLKPGAALWVNCPDEMAAHVVLMAQAAGLRMINWCIWSYRFGVWRPGNFIRAKTHVLYFVNTEAERKWYPDGILVDSDRATKYGDRRTTTTKTPGKRVPLDVWGSEGDGGFAWGRVQGNSKERSKLHENQLPEVYLERVISCCTQPGDLVLDPFLGSGTTMVVARALGRRSIGIEISTRYARSALARVKKGAVRVGRATTGSDQQ